MKILIVSGTPCSGKTTLAKKLAKKLSCKYIDVNKIIKKYKLAKSYDKKRECYIVDIKKLNKKLIGIINQYKKLSLEKKMINKNLFKKIKNKKIKGMVIDSHLSHYLPRKYVDLCIITKCELKELERRLKKRGYIKAKIRENLDCEIFDICYNEALENKHRVIVIDTTKGINMNSINKIIWKIGNY